MTFYYLFLSDIVHNQEASSWKVNTCMALLYSIKLSPALENVMQWHLASPDINPVENLWSTIKRDVYENRKQ